MKFRLVIACLACIALGCSNKSVAPRAEVTNAVRADLARLVGDKPIASLDTVNTAVPATTKKGQELQAIVSALRSDRKTLDASLDDVGVGKISKPELLGTAIGRKKARTMVTSMKRALSQHHERRADLTNRTNIWIGSVPAERRGEAWRSAREEAFAVISGLAALLDFLDKENPKLDSKGTMKMTGMSKGLKYEELVGKVNGAVARWVFEDERESAHEEQMLVAAINERLGLEATGR